MPVGIPSKVFAEHTGGVAVMQAMAATAEHPEKARAPMFCNVPSSKTVQIEDGKGAAAEERRRKTPRSPAAAGACRMAQY